MADLLAFLDAAIDDLEREISSRCSRSSDGVHSPLGTVNPLDIKRVPVVPVLPVRKLKVQGSIAVPADAESNSKRDGRAQESYSKRTGRTGTTGTDQSFSGVAFPSQTKENGDEREHGMREADESRKPMSVGELAICSDVEDEYASLMEPLLLRDGRRMWRFPAGQILSARPDFLLVDEARLGTLHATLIPPMWRGSRWWVVALTGEVVGDQVKYGALRREVIEECV